MGRRLPVERPQEVQEVQERLVPMALTSSRGPRSVGHIEGGGQGPGAVADVVVGDALDVAEAQRRQGLLPLR